MEMCRKYLENILSGTVYKTGKENEEKNKFLINLFDEN